jgi:hypothetical protein
MVVCHPHHTMVDDGGRALILGKPIDDTPWLVSGSFPAMT